MISRVTVNSHHIRHNRKARDKKAVLVHRTSKGNFEGNEIIVKDRDGRVVGRFVYRPLNPLTCGAEVWFETDSDDLVLETFSV